MVAAVELCDSLLRHGNFDRVRWRTRGLSAFALQESFRSRIHVYDSFWDLPSHHGAHGSRVFALCQHGFDRFNPGDYLLHDRNLPANGSVDAQKLHGLRPRIP